MCGTAGILVRVVFLALVVTLLSACSLFSRKEQPIANDAALQTEVKNALNRDPALIGAQINVRSADGVIRLSGAVKSPAVKSRAGLVAATIPGIVQVHNDLLTPVPAL
jgi:osmotically-inducible protein OsmY